MVLKTSVKEPETEPHLFGGAGTATQCGSGSGSDGSKLNYELRWITKNVTHCNSFYCSHSNIQPFKSYKIQRTKQRQHLGELMFVFKKLACYIVG
jgi:hypothetical protein